MKVRNLEIWMRIHQEWLEEIVNKYDYDKFVQTVVPDLVLSPRTVRMHDPVYGYKDSKQDLPFVNKQKYINKEKVK